METINIILSLNPKHGLNTKHDVNMNNQKQK